MFSKSKQIKKLENENKELKTQIKSMNKALQSAGHTHEFDVLDKILLNGFEVSNGHTEEHLVKSQCRTCGLKKDEFVIGDER